MRRVEEDASSGRTARIPTELAAFPTSLRAPWPRIQENQVKALTDKLRNTSIARNQRTPQEVRFKESGATTAVINRLKEKEIN